MLNSPERLLALDYGKRGDLYIRFKHAEKPVGAPTRNGLIIFFYEDSNFGGLL